MADPAAQTDLFGFISLRPAELVGADAAERTIALAPPAWLKTAGAKSKAVVASGSAKRKSKTKKSAGSDTAEVKAAKPVRRPERTPLRRVSRPGNRCRP